MRRQLEPARDVSENWRTMSLARTALAMKITTELFDRRGQHCVARGYGVLRLFVLQKKGKEIPSLALDGGLGRVFLSYPTFREIISEICRPSF